MERATVIDMKETMTLQQNADQRVKTGGNPVVVELECIESVLKFLTLCCPKSLPLLETVWLQSVVTSCADN